MKFKNYNLLDKETGIIYQVEAIDKEKAFSITAFTIIKNNWKTTTENILADKNKKVVEFLMSNIIKRLLIIDFK